MIDIRLYKGFTKILNSTVTPVAQFQPGDLYQCNFLDAQSIMNPVIVIEDTKGKDDEMAEYTYAYIPTLKRYYFVSNVVVVDNLRWVTHTQNMNNPITKNHLKKNTGYLIEIEEIKTGMLFYGLKETSEYFKVSETTILNHLNNKVKNPR